MKFMWDPYTFIIVEEAHFPFPFISTQLILSFTNFKNKPGKSLVDLFENMLVNFAFNYHKTCLVIMFTSTLGLQRGVGKSVAKNHNKSDHSGKNKQTLALNAVKKICRNLIIVYMSTIFYEDYCGILEMEIFVFRFLI